MVMAGMTACFLAGLFGAISRKRPFLRHLLRDGRKKQFCKGKSLAERVAEKQSGTW